VLEKQVRSSSKGFKNSNLPTDSKRASMALRSVDVASLTTDETGRLSYNLRSPLDQEMITPKLSAVA